MARWKKFICSLLISTGLFCFRSANIQEDFWFRGDQTRDWKIAASNFTDLPLVGSPKSGGGHHLGPEFYWDLWLIRHVSALWSPPLPHYGGIGLLLERWLADTLLIWALFAMGLGSAAIASAFICFQLFPIMIGADRTIWDPGLMVSILELTLALVCFRWHRHPLGVLLIVAMGWMAVQIHLSALVVVLPLFGSMFWEHKQQDFKRCALLSLLSGALILVMQIPYALHSYQDSRFFGTTTTFQVGIKTMLSAPLSLDVSKWLSIAAYNYALLFGPQRPFRDIVVLFLTMLMAFAFVSSHEQARRWALILFQAMGFMILSFAAMKMCHAYWLFALLPVMTIVLALSLEEIYQRCRARYTLPFVLGVAWVYVPLFEPRFREARDLHYGVTLKAIELTALKYPRVGSVKGVNEVDSVGAADIYQMSGGTIDHKSPRHLEVSPGRVSSWVLPPHLAQPRLVQSSFGRFDSIWHKVVQGTED